MDETKGNARIRWREDYIKCFLEACIEEGSLRKESWICVQKQLQEVCDLKVSRKQMKNEFDYLKGKYAAWLYLKGKRGNLYNSKTNTFNFTNQEWEDFSKEHPKVKTLRNSPLVFPDLCTALFKKTCVPKSHVSSYLHKSPNIQPIQIENIPKNSQEVGTQILNSPKIQPLQIEDIPKTSQEVGTQILNSPIVQPLQIEDIPKTSQEVGTHSLNSPNVQPLQIEDIPKNSQEVGTQILKSPIIQPIQIEDIPSNSQESGTQNHSNIPCNQSDTVGPLVDKESTSRMNSDLDKHRPKKKGKSSMKVSQLEENLSSVLREIVKSHDGPSQEECVEKLNKVGWDTISCSYVAALGIFCEGPSYRKGWMLLPIDNVELLKSWVVSVGRKLGYL